MPYPSYQNRQGSRNTYRSSNDMDSWDSPRGNNDRFSSNGSGIDMSMAQSIIGSLLGGGGENNAIARLANQLAGGQRMANVGRGGGSDSFPMMRDRENRQHSSSRSRDYSSFRGGQSQAGNRHRQNRSPPRRVANSSFSSKQDKRDNSPNYRPQFEVYVGNYPARFDVEDLRKLFQDNGVFVGSIRMKADGFKSFSFAETGSADDVERAVRIMDSKLIAGRRLRVRSAHDKYGKKNTERNSVETKSSTVAVTAAPPIQEKDSIPFLVTSVIHFLERQSEYMSVVEDEKPEDEKEEVVKANDSSGESSVKTIGLIVSQLRYVFGLSVDEDAVAYTVSRRLETTFLNSFRREITKLLQPSPVANEEAASSVADEENTTSLDKHADEEEEIHVMDHAEHGDELEEGTGVILGEEEMEDEEEEPVIDDINFEYDEGNKEVEESAEDDSAEVDEAAEMFLDDQQKEQDVAFEKEKNTSPGRGRRGGRRARGRRARY